MTVSDKHSSELYRLCERFVRDSIETVGRSLSYSTIQVPGEELFKIVPLRDFVESRGSEIRGLDSLSECVEFLFEDPQLRAKRDHTFLIDQFVEFFKELVRQNWRLEFDCENFNALYSDFELYLYSDEDEYSLFAPLDNFQCSLQKIDIDSDSRIRKLSGEEKSNIQKYEVFRATSPLAPALGIGSFEFVLEGVCKIRKDDVIDFSQSIESLREIIYALRLYKRGDIGCPTVRISPKRWSSYGKDFSAEHPVVPPVGRPAGRCAIPYYLAEHDVKKLKRLWDSYQKYLTHRQDFIGLSVRRFNYAYERERADDKLIDFMIAFEVLYSKKGDRSGEHTHKLSVRTACLLEEKYGRRKVLRNTMRNAYGIASAIRHGEEQKVDLELLLAIEDRLRLSIQEFMVTSTKHDEIIDKLDLKKSTS